MKRTAYNEIKWSPEMLAVFRDEWIEGKPLQEIAARLSKMGGQAISFRQINLKAQHLCFPPYKRQKKQYKSQIIISGRTDNRVLPAGSPDTWSLISGGKPWPEELARHAR